MTILRDARTFLQRLWRRATQAADATPARLRASESTDPSVAIARPPAGLIHDDPIESVDEDLIELAPVADRIARVVADWPGSRSLVVGLFGPWGVGKTSTLRLLEARLRLAPFNERVIVARFNPWLYPDADSLLRSFFATLWEATGKTALISPERRAELEIALESIGGTLTAIAGAAGQSHAGDATIATAATAGAIGATRAFLRSGDRKLESERERARAVLGQLANSAPPARIVMLIDDVDRAERSEVKMLLRLIRLVADFPAVTYVCAADFDRTARIVAEDGGEDGRQYLEKIFQVSVPLAGVSRAKLRRLLADGIDSLFAGTRSAPAGGIEAAFERRRLEVRELLLWRVHTLRDRARFLNALRVLLLSGADALEVDSVDACLISLLSAFYPSLVERLRRNEEFLLGTGSFSALLRTSGGKDKEHAEQRERTLGSFISGESRSMNEGQLDPEDVGVHSPSAANPASLALQEAALYATLIALFPHVLKAGDLTREVQERLRIDNRICSPDRFERYFAFGSRPDEVSDESTATVIAAADEAGKGATRSSATDLFLQTLAAYSKSQRTDLFERILDRRADLTPSATLTIADGVASLAVDEELRGDEALRFLLRLSGYRPGRVGEAEMTEDELAKAEACASAIKNLVDKATETWESVFLAGEATRALVANRILDDGRLRSGMGESVPSWIREIAVSGLERLRRHVGGGRDPFEKLTLRDFAEVLWRWRDIAWIENENLSELRDYLRQASKDTARMPQLLAAFFNFSPAGPTDPRSPSELRAALQQVWSEKEAMERARAAEVTPRGEDTFNVVGRFISILSG